MITMPIKSEICKMISLENSDKIVKTPLKS